MQLAQIASVVLLGGALAGFSAGCASQGGQKVTAAPAGPSASAPAPSSGGPSASEAEVERLVQAHAAYAAGLVAQDNNTGDQGLEYFAKSVAADPGNEQLALEVARRYLERKQGEKAVAVLKRTVAQPGTSGAAKSFLALTYYQLGRKDEAIAAYREALKVLPASLTSSQALAQLLADQKQPEEALKVLRAAGKQPVDNAAYWVDLSLSLGRLGAREPKLRDKLRPDVLAALDKASALKPDEPVLLQKMGETYEALGEIAKAETLYKELRERFPKNPLPAAMLADLYLKQGRPKEAREHLEALKREDPTNPRPFHYLGLIAFEEQDYETAADDFSHALLLNADYEPAYADLAAARLSMEQPEPALETLNKARDRFPLNFRREFLAGIAESRLKRFEPAIARFQAAEKVAREKLPEALDFRFYFQAGSVLERGGHGPEAEKYLLKSIELKPDFDEALNYLGYMWADLGTNLPKALELIERAVKIEPENPAYLDSLGWVLFKMGKAREAVAPLEKAVQLSPEPDAAVLDHLGDALLAANRPEDAREAWRKSLAAEKNDAVQRKLDALR
jgi:tetratricopeptide (TPR) repeat protein